MPNLFDAIPEQLPEELFETILLTSGFRLERIVSTGQATPPGQWYDQDTDEWVILLRGRAVLLFAGETDPQVLEPGDYVLIPAHRRHRVESTAPDVKTVWLALHYEA